MKRLFLLAATCAAALSLGACANPWANQFVSAKLQTAGANFSPTTGATFGYAALTGHFVPTTAVNGSVTSLLTVAQPCGQADVIATYSNLSAKASASATSTGVAAAPGVQAPTVAWASGDTSASGAAARIIALGGGLAPTPEALKAYQDACPGSTALPSAPAGSIMLDGEAPSPASTAPTPATAKTGS